MTRTTIHALRAAAFVGTMIVAAPAFAQQTTTDTVDVSATVTSNCVVTANPIAFGNVDVTNGSNVDGSGTLSVTCTSGTIWAASADAGAGTGATLSTRKMANGTNLLNYALYTDTARTTIWGDGSVGGGSKIGDTGSGTAQSKTFYGRVSSGQTSLPAGAYADTVTVTVTY